MTRQHQRLRQTRKVGGGHGKRQVQLHVIKLRLFDKIGLFIFPMVYTETLCILLLLRFVNIVPVNFRLISQNPIGFRATGRREVLPEGNTHWRHPFVICQRKYDVHVFQRSIRGLREEEVYHRYDQRVKSGKDCKKYSQRVQSLYQTPNQCKCPS
jgi:hypothetical protein